MHIRAPFTDTLCACLSYKSVPSSSVMISNPAARWKYGKTVANRNKNTSSPLKTQLHKSLRKQGAYNSSESVLPAVFSSMAPCYEVIKHQLAFLARLLLVPKQKSLSLPQDAHTERSPTSMNPAPFIFKNSWTQLFSNFKWQVVVGQSLPCRRPLHYELVRSLFV